jgi:hypothetical protein
VKDAGEPQPGPGFSDTPCYAPPPAPSLLPFGCSSAWREEEEENRLSVFAGPCDGFCALITSLNASLSLLKPSSSPNARQGAGRAMRLGLWGACLFLASLAFSGMEKCLSAAYHSAVLLMVSRL